jgi:hypothetical protein
LVQAQTYFLLTYWCINDGVRDGIAPADVGAIDTTNEGMDETMEGVEDDAETMVDPSEGLKSEDVSSLTESTGFSLIRAQKGLLYGNGGTVEGAVEWLLEHQDDDYIDERIPTVPKEKSTGGAAVGGSVGGGPVAISYKCVATGKIFANMADLELHANRTGHSDFEAVRTEREMKEKVDDVDREKQRRFMGQEMAKTREQMEIEER